MTARVWGKNSPQVAPVRCSAEALLSSGIALLAPEETVLDAMIQGWGSQQRSRALAATTIEARRQVLGRFVRFSGEYPWNWGPGDVEEWPSEMVGRGLSPSAIRNYQAAVSLFCGYVADPRYRWVEVCEQHFATHPVQVFHEWNTVVHRSDYEGRPGNRPMTREELQKFFDYCDDRVATIAKSGRKGWLAAYRNATLFKATYAWGLRRREATKLETVDWSANADFAQFGRYGALSVRWGKALRGGPPRRRTVLTVMEWAAEAVAEWTEEIRPQYGERDKSMWPTERGGSITPTTMNQRFAEYRDAVGLDSTLGPHCLRHSYATHLLEDGFDHLFVQQQLGHSWGSSTAIYSDVGSEYKNDALQRALSRAFE